MTKRRLEKNLALIALITVIIAGVSGFMRETGGMEHDISSMIPEGSRAEPKGEGQFIIFHNENEAPSAFIAIENAQGFGGDLVMAILVDTLGTIRDIKVIKHQETPSFLEKVFRKGLLNQLTGISYSQSFDSEHGIDVVSGASYTSDAIIECAKQGARHISERELGLEVPVEEEYRFSIGIPELALIFLYVVAMIGIYTHFRYKKILRWFTMVSSLFVLGFWFSVPLTLSRINLFLLGFWPEWHDNLYWYILVLGFFLILLVTRKNIYCSWICPLGCIQDVLGLVGDAKPRFSKKFNDVWTWIQRGVAWLAIILALFFRNPVKVNYEIFGVSLSLTGATYLFIMTGIFFIASIFIKRSWCNYLCPITPVADLVRTLRSRSTG